MVKLICSFDDLHNWVIDRVDPHFPQNSEDHADAIRDMAVRNKLIAREISLMDDCPMYGQDWSAFLAELPDDLHDVLPLREER